MIVRQRACVVTDLPTIQENIYATLRNKICFLEYVPGSIMSANEIAASMAVLMQKSVSRTPVREAFIRLAKEGLVFTLPQHGTVVTKIKPERAREERYLRYVLEKEALSYIPENAEKEDYRELYDIIAKQEKAMEEGNNIQFIELDNEFHHKQYKIAGCELFLDVVTTFNSHYDRMRNLTAWDKDNVKNSIQQHKDLLYYLEKKEIDKAQMILKKHLSKLIDEEKTLLEIYPDYFDLQA